MPLHAYTLGVLSYIHLHAGNGDAALRVLDTAKDVLNDVKDALIMGGACARWPPSSSS